MTDETEPFCVACAHPGGYRATENLRECEWEGCTVLLCDECGFVECCERSLCSDHYVACNYCDRTHCKECSSWGDKTNEVCAQCYDKLRD